MTVHRRPRTNQLQDLASSAVYCKACPLYKNATQTVFGTGSTTAAVVLVGEAPGDQEDKEGHPFVGPAGQFLNKCLESLGIDRGDLYLTNSVKHFKWIARGKRRLHQKPNAREVAACRPWLEAELKLLQPRLIVALGATAAQALMGKDFRVTKDRGRFFSSPWSEKIFATVHPSSLLRMPTAQREKEIKRWCKDLRQMKRFLSASSSSISS